MAIIRQVQRGSVTKAAGTATVTVTFPQALLDTSKSILYFSIQTANTANPARDGLMMGELISTTQATFSDNSGGTNPAVLVEWQVVEYWEGVTVQRGTVTAVTAPTNVTISAVNTAKSWVMVTAKANSGHVGNQSQCRATITSSTNLELFVQNNTNATVAWQVIQYDNCSVQTIQTTVSNGALTTDVTISAVETSRTLLFANFYTASGTLSATNWSAYYLLNSTTVRFQQQATAGGSCLYTLQVVTFTENEARVQRFTQTIATTDTTINIVLSELNTLYSMIMIRGLYDTNGAINYNSDLNDRTAFETQITSSIQAYIQRATAGSSGIVSIEVWEKIVPTYRWHMRGSDVGMGRKMH